MQGGRNGKRDGNHGFQGEKKGECKMYQGRGEDGSMWMCVAERK